MEGQITNFRRGRHTVSSNQMIVEVVGIKNKEEAYKLVGKEVVWTSTGKKEIKGKITKAHGNSGALRVKFDTGMPGQAVGTRVNIK